MIKTILKSVLSFFLIIGLFLGAAYSLIHTTPGAKFVLWLAQHHLPGTIAYSGFEGTLSDHIQIQKLHYQNQDTEFSADNVSCQIDLTALLKKELPIKFLSLSAMEMKIHDTLIKVSDIKFKGVADIKKYDVLITADLTSPIPRKIKLKVLGNWQDFNAVLSPIEFPLDKILSGQYTSEMRYHGNAILSGTISNTPKTNTVVALKIAINPGKITLPTDHRVQEFPFKGGEILVNLNPTESSATLNMDFIQHSTLRATATLPTLSSTTPIFQQRLTGNIDWRFPDVSFLTAFINTISNVQGEVNLHFKIDGSAEKPAIIGTGQLQQGNFHVPKFHTSVSDFHLQAEATGQKIVYQGTATAGSGKLSLEGNTLLSKSGFPTELHITGNNATLVNTHEFKINASPNIHANYADQKLTLAGNIVIPSGQIRPDDSTSTNTLPDDVVIIDSSAPKTPVYNVQLISHLQLTLGDNVDFKMMGVTGKLTGKMNIHDSPSQPTTAQGELTLLQGQSEMYGAKLSVPRGKLIFTGGPVTNPGLDIRAIRKFNQDSPITSDDIHQPTTAGIKITGTLQKPVVNLFSNSPHSNPSDTLAYLITGQSINQVGEGQAQILLQAAGALDFGDQNAFSKLRNQLKNKLGLNEFDITGQSEYDKQSHQVIQHTSLVLGKYLSPKLYVKYRYDIHDHTPKVNVHYKLNKHWSLQSESSPSSSGVDLLYTIERK